MTDPQQTIDDLLPPCFKKLNNGKYEVQGVVLQTHAETGFAFATVVNNSNGPQNFFVFYEDTGAVQSEEKRVYSAFFATGMRSSKENNIASTFTGELLPPDYSKCTTGGKPYRGLRLTSMTW